MNQLPLNKRVLILKLLVSDVSITQTAWVANVAINTVIKLLIDAGKACLEYHDKAIKKCSGKASPM